MSQRIGSAPDIGEQADPLFHSPRAVQPQTSPQERAFRAIYEENFAFVWRCLRSLGVPPAGLDDAAQEVFLVVHRRLDSYREDGALRTWLYGIVKKVAANVRRTLQRKGGHSPLVEEPPSTEPSPQEDAEDAELAAFVRRFMAGLSEAKRDVFLLAIVEELAMPEVAATLGVPLNTAYTRLRSVRQEFERAFERERRRSR